MKDFSLINLAGVLFLSVLLACSGEGNRKISVTDSDDTYEFFAKFDRHQTRRVQDFINTKIAPGSSITGDHVDISTTLDDKTRFKLEASPGRIRIKLDKEDNSAASYHRIKTMCEGIKKVIEEQ
jgi:hypothetical protein